MNNFFRAIWNTSKHTWITVDESGRHNAKKSQNQGHHSHHHLLTASYGLIVALSGGDAAAVDIQLFENDTKTILGGYKDKAAGSADSATLVSDNIIFMGGTLDLTGGYYRSIGKMTVSEGQYGRITGGSGTGVPSYFPTIPSFDTPPSKSGAMFLLYDPRKSGGQLVLEKNSMLEIDFKYDGRNYIAVTNNGNYNNSYIPVVFGENSHIKLTGGTFRYDPYRHDTDVKLSNFIFNGGWLSTRGGDDIITADKDNQLVGKIEMGMGSDIFIIPEGIHLSALQANGQPASEVRMYEFADTQDKGTGGLTGSMAEGTGTNPSDRVEIRANASSTDINYNFGYYNDVMTLAAGAILTGGTVNMGNGPDIFSADSSTLNGASLKLGDGDDILNLSATSLQGGTAIDLGNGNDIANLNNLELRSSAVSPVLMGAGNDIANLTNVTIQGQSNTDSLNFGTGNDTLNLTRVLVDQARIGMVGGNNIVNVVADLSGGTTQIDDSLTFTSADNLSTLRVLNNAALQLNNAQLGFTGKVDVNAGGTLSGSGSVISTGGIALNGVMQVGDGQSDGQLNLTDNLRIDANNGNIITGSGVLTSSGLTLNGMTQAIIDAGRKLVYSNELSGNGSLDKLGGGTFVLEAQNSYSGGSTVESGTLVLKNHDAAGIGGIAIDSGATTQLAFSGTENTFDAIFDNTLSGTGQVVINGRDIDVTSDNSNFSGLLTVLSNSSMQVREAINLGKAVTQVDGTLNVAPLSGNFIFNNVLTGSGILAAQMNDVGDFFDFNRTAGADFSGIFAMGQGSFSLSGDNTHALGKAMLRTDNNSTATVGSGVQQIGGLAFNGGTVVFDATVPDATRAASSVSTSVLDARGTGTIKVTIPAPYIPSVPGTLDTATLLEQDDGNIGVQLVAADQVIGSGGALSLRDQDEIPISAMQQVEIAQGGETVANGTYDFGLTTAPGDGLYVNYGLRVVDLQNTRTLTLEKTPGASGAAADLAAKVTGMGNLGIEAEDGTISLSNATNDYGGETSVHSGTLKTLENHALGHTSVLNLATNTAVALAGTSQTIGELQASSDSLIELQDGNFNITNGGNANGTLSGGGYLNLEGGLLKISQANTHMSALTDISQGASVSMSQVSGLGTGGITDNGELMFDAAKGIVSNTISGKGEVKLNKASEIEVSGDNQHFSGQFILSPESH
jgi:autotransporter family porin